MPVLDGYESTERIKSLISESPTSVKKIPTVNLSSLVTDFPATLVEKLEKSADACDADSLDKVIEEDRRQNTALADILARLSEKYDYNGILNLIDKAKSKTKRSFPKQLFPL